MTIQSLIIFTAAFVVGWLKFSPQHREWLWTKRTTITVSKAELVKSGQWAIARQVIQYLKYDEFAESMPMSHEISMPWNHAAEIGLVRADLFGEYQDKGRWI